jgi:uncharacterized membrane protein
VTRGDKVRVIFFWSLMVVLALVLAKMNTVADFFVRMNIAGQDDRMKWLLNYILLALVVVLFLFVGGIDLGRKSRKRILS